MSDYRTMQFRNRLMALRQDAEDKGMLELAITYGWSAIRLSEEIIAENQRVLSAHSHSR